MNITRRDFLKLSGLAGIATCLPPVQLSRPIGTWLRMYPVNGDYPIPMDDAAYKTQADLFSRIYPTFGGKLQQNGSWLQETWKFSSWARGLHKQGKLYMPTLTNDRLGVLTVLDNPDLQCKAVDEIAAIAMTRFDAPWDGVLVDIEGPPSVYRDRLSDFYRLLVDKLHEVGLIVNIRVRGRTGDNGPDYDDAYTNDFAAIAEIADMTTMDLYGYWNPTPRGISPYWWQRACIEYALSKGFRPGQLNLGAGTYSRIGNSTCICQDQAFEMADAGVMWIEANKNGIIREWYDPYHAMWLHDGLTLRQSLALVDEYGLGFDLFTPSMAGADVWDVLRAWM